MLGRIPSTEEITNVGSDVRPELQTRQDQVEVKMRITQLGVLFPLLLSSSLSAQNAPAPAAITPRLDTPQTRVIVATLQPRTPSIAKSGHATNRVLIYLDDGAMTRKEGESSTKMEFHRGD